jgi:hypothetical protein
MRRLLREPLLHFLVVGALIYALYGLVADDPAVAPDRVVVDERSVGNLVATFQRTWMRPPTAEELDALIRDFVDEEILVRESLALGLDRDDPVIRRRLRQKMEYLHADLAEPEKPTDAELAAFLLANRERFEEPAKLSFRHVFVSPDVGSPAAWDRANELLRKLQTGVSDASVAGDSTLLPESMRKASERDVGSVFGAAFAGDVFGLAGDEWSGPVASSYGLHLVRVDERVAARPLELEEVRREVERDYAADRRAEANQRFLQELRERYEVEIRTPSVDPVSPPSSLGD